MITRVSYGGWANNVKLTNGRIELIATLDVGPRIIRLGYVGGKNLFAERQEELGQANESEFKVRGGHRFWLAPEVVPRTYYPDNVPVSLEELDEYTIRLISQEAENGIQKEIEIRMSADSDEITVSHRLTNLGRWEITAAPWALSAMAPDGKAIIPLPEQKPHAGNFIPQAAIVLWPSSDMSDSRIRWGQRYITFTQDRKKGPSKFGMIQPFGWAAYSLKDQLFIKYFDYIPTATYPDFGCNFETYSDEEILELESLGPLTLLAPGEYADHVETWRLIDNAPEITDEESIAKNILPRL